MQDQHSTVLIAFKAKQERRRFITRRLSILLAVAGFSFELVGLYRLSVGIALVATYLIIIGCLIVLVICDALSLFVDLQFILN